MRFDFLLITLFLLVTTTNSATYNVRLSPYNALADGSDDRPRIQSALNDAAANGGGTVYIPAGNYRIGCIDGVGAWVGLTIGTNTKMMGDGATASIISIIPGQAHDDCRLITNKNRGAGGGGGEGGLGDQNITFEDFAVNGDAKQVPNIPSMVGIQLISATHIKFNRIVVKNIKGTPNGAEGAGFDVHYSSHISYTDCEATRTSHDTSSYPTKTGSGFSANYSTGIEYKGCRASFSTSWQGFTHMLCRNVSYANCHAYGNHLVGFNSESSTDIQFVNCISGGLTNKNKQSYHPYPYTDTTNLGNGTTGFTIAGSKNVIISNCISEKNRNYGLYVTNNTIDTITYEAESIRIMGGAFTENGGTGPNDGQMFFQNQNYARATRITGGPVLGNTSLRRMRSVTLAGAGYPYNFNVSGVLTPIVNDYLSTTPTSNSEILNRYPFDILVTVIGSGISQLSITNPSDVNSYDPLIIASTGGTFKVPAGCKFKFTFSSFTSWSWVVAD